MIQAKLLIIVGAILLLGAIAAGIYDKGGDNREAKIVAKYEALIAVEKSRIAAAEKAADTITRSKDLEHQATIADLQSRIDAIKPTPGGVRLCKQSSSASAASVPTSPSESTESAGGGGSGVRVGEDIERELVQYAKRCETDRLAVIGWQSWYHGQAEAWAK